MDKEQLKQSIEINNFQEVKRRKPGTGSLYEINTGQKDKNGDKKIKYGICVQLKASKELKQRFGNKLRYLKTFNTISEAEAGVEYALNNSDNLLKEKLQKLGYVERDESVITNNNIESE